MNNYTTNELILKALEQIVNNPIAVELAKRLDDVIADSSIEIMTMDGQITDLENKAEYFEAKYEKEYMENQRLQAQLDSDEKMWVELEARVNTLEEGKKSC